MFKKSCYIYGPNDVQVPANINFGDFILDRMWQYRNNIALINGTRDERISYGELVQQAMNLAISLTRMGVKKGDAIGIFSENRQEYFAAVVGVACAGAVMTPFNSSYINDELIHVMNISKPCYVICSPTVYKTHGSTLRALPFLKQIILFGEETHSEVIMYNDLTLERNRKIKNVKYEEFQSVEVQGQVDTLFIVYSSGTTGLPKGVMLTHLNLITASSLRPSLDPKESNLTISPWYHVMGLMGTLCGLALGKTSVYIAKFEMDLYFKIIEKYKISQLTVVPPVLVAACKYQTKYDLSSVKVIYSGAAPLHKETIISIHEKFPNCRNVCQGYGATEVTLALMRFSYLEYNPQKIGSIGTVISNTIIKVVDIESRKPLGPNTPGEICAKGSMLMKGYVGRDRGDDFDDEGFYKTGDIGYYDEEGYFYILDRIKELIKYKGYQVPPAELEAVLLQHPSINDAAVIGLDDKLAGELPLAFVVIRPGQQLTEKEVQDFIAERLSNPKRLRGGVRFVSKIPKSASGKILRKELRIMVNTVKSHL
ncbi:unnamed protein product [Arctia plantaginis]|uniref:Luciferin 4-monooxygenase n=1 Tax=Arctia plantaginis TaxID=874455 RepID=A0A8S1BRY8_ARCPL|nr:unnamed protein product [Arctia plantaginis]